MGVVSKLSKTTVVGGAATFGAFFFGTRDAIFVPFPATDPIFKSTGYKTYNPARNPPSIDFCVKKVPLSAIKPEFLQEDGRLVEAFCAGVWGGWGYAPQRIYLSRAHKGPLTSHQLWSRQQLLSSSYQVGTQMTDHFEVLEHTADHITTRAGGSPLHREVRLLDGLFEMTVKVNEVEGVAEFGLKSMFFQGIGIANTAPLTPFVHTLHQWYTKLLMITAIQNVK